VDGLLSNSCIKGKVTSVQKLKHGLLQRRLYVKTRPSEKLDKFSSELIFEVTFLFLLSPASVVLDGDGGVSSPGL
jgi:hypothetical protein